MKECGWVPGRAACTANCQHNDIVRLLSLVDNDGPLGLKIGVGELGWSMHGVDGSAGLSDHWRLAEMSGEPEDRGLLMGDVIDVTNGST